MAILIQLSLSRAWQALGHHLAGFTVLIERRSLVGKRPANPR